MAFSGVFASQSYRWSVNDILGTGATAKVYKGRNKETGEWVAIKEFQPKMPRAEEFQIMKTLQHKNIVRFIALEEEATRNIQVLIMELSTVGCLLTHICKPENLYGLEEEDFKGLLRDCSKGLDYLRKNEIVHRDFKPNNIMRFVRNEHGGVDVIYKITDFGAAKFLSDEENFVSLYGTYEYLHPLMFARAMGSLNTPGQFDATVDIWSLGCTLFHAATGTLPFTPFKGVRGDAGKHVQMVSQKPTSVICAKQRRWDGPIDYSEHLPESCPLSKDCKELCEQMFANIFDLQWSFAEFFNAAQILLSKVVIHAFLLNSAQLDRLYMNSNDGFSLLIDSIRKRFSINPSIEMRFMLNDEFLEISSHSMATFPETSPSNPLVVILDSSEGFTLATEPSIVNSHFFQPGLDTKGCIEKSTKICADIHRIKTKVSCIDTKSRLLKNVSKCAIANVQRMLSDVHQDVQELVRVTKSCDSCLNISLANHEAVSRLIREVFASEKCTLFLRQSYAQLEANSNHFKSLKASLSCLAEKVEQWWKRYAVNNFLQQQWKETEPQEFSSYSVGIMCACNEDALEIKKCFIKRKNDARPSDEDSYDKLLLIKLFNKSCGLLQDCLKSLHDLHFHIGSFFCDTVFPVEKTVTEFRGTLTVLEKTINRFDIDINNFQRQNAEDIQNVLLPELKRAFSERIKKEKKCKSEYLKILQELKQMQADTSFANAVFERIGSLDLNERSRLNNNLSPGNLSDAASSTGDEE